MTAGRPAAISCRHTRGRFDDSGELSGSSDKNQSPPARLLKCRPEAIVLAMITMKLLSRLARLWPAGIAALALACQDNPGSSAPGQKAGTAPAQDPAGVQTYTVTGVVKELKLAEKIVRIAHDEVPGYMPPMTMPFTVRQTNEAAGLQPGHTVTFRLNVTDNDSWIDRIKVTGTAQPPAPEREPVRLVRDVEELKVGDLLPDYRFTNQFERPVQLKDFRGQALALTFIFTRCPIPNFCPLMSRNFMEVTQKLTSTPGAPTNWHLLSISFDPHFDTPAVLKSYAERFNYNPKHWSFVTGAMIDIDAITEQFNLPIVVREGQWDHKLRTVVVDAEGRIQKILIANQWKTDELYDELVKAAGKAPARSP